MTGSFPPHLKIIPPSITNIKTTSELNEYEKDKCITTISGSIGKAESNTILQGFEEKKKYLALVDKTSSYLVFSQELKRFLVTSQQEAQSYNVPY